MTLTTRLTAFFLGSLAVVLATFSITLFVLTRSQLFRELDERIESYAAQLAATVEMENVEPVGLEWDRQAEHMKNIPAEAMRWAAYDEHAPIAGNLQSDAPWSELLPTRGLQDVVLAGQRWRGVSRTVIYPHPEKITPASISDASRYRQLTFVTVMPIAPIYQSLQALCWRLSIISIGTLLAGAILSRWVCWRGLAPLSRMAYIARSIRPEQLSARLPVPPARDELRELGSAFNDVLTRVQEAMEKQAHFTSIASHQLRTPLTAMLGQLELALRRERPIGDYQQTLQLVQAQAKRLHTLVEKLLFLAKAEAGALSPDLDIVDLAAWLPRYVKSVWSSHRRYHDIKVNVSVRTSLCVQIHIELFEQAIGNLIDNATKYSDDGTAIHVCLRQQGSEAVLYVRDQGIGIQRHDVPQLFNPFFRAEWARERGIEGVGMGLAVASRIVSSFGGHIAYDHNDHGGSFSISVPLVMA